MRSQKGLDGVTPINATAKYLLVGPASETEAELALAAIYPATVATANPFTARLELLVEPRLGSSNAWFTFADPAALPVLEYAYLASAPGPQIESRADVEREPVVDAPLIVRVRRIRANVVAYAALQDRQVIVRGLEDDECHRRAILAAERVRPGTLGGASLEQLAGLPPALVIVDENDVLRDEGEAYARRLIQAGVPTTSVRYNAIIHDFMMLNPVRATQAATAAVVQAIHTLRKALGT